MADIKDITKPVKIKKSDWKYMLEKPDGDPDFNPDHNRRVIEATIKNNDRLAKKIKKNYLENELGERIDAVAYYMRQLAKHKSYTPEHYFGKRYLAYLRGDEIRERIKAEIVSNRLKMGIK